MTKTILDATAGSRMFWWDKQNPNAVFMDRRKETLVVTDRGKERVIEINPDVVADFRNMPFDDESFNLVVFDPPHLVRSGKNSWLAKKYGVLNPKTWPQDLKQGFEECMRVLKQYGTLVFKWNDDQIGLSEVLRAVDYEPLFGDKRSKTHWLFFMKTYEEVTEDEYGRN